MAAIPYGAFAACKAMRKDMDTDLKVSRSIAAYEPKIPNRKVLEYTPVQYNSKMMNSIWGFYNRYSPHNIKKSCDADLHFNYGKGQQQRYVLSAAGIYLLPKIFIAINHPLFQLICFVAGFYQIPP